MKTSPAAEEHFGTLFRKQQNEIEKQSTALLNKEREPAIRHFLKEGFPGPGNEAYKYTDIAKLFTQPLKLNLHPNNIHFDVREAFQCDVPELETHVIVLVNGFLLNKGPSLFELEGKVLAGSLAEATRRYPELVSPHYNAYTGENPGGLVALNTGFAQDGFFVYIPKGVVMEKPIQVIEMSVWEEDLMIQARNLIIAEENSMGNVVVCDHTLAPWRFLNNTVTEVYTGKQAVLDITKMQNENNSSQHLSHTFVLQEALSKLTYNTLTLHGGLVRNNFYACLNGEGAENNTYGLYLSDRKQHVDNYSFIDHAVPGCTSNQLFKGVLDDEATGAFTGKIMVRKDAQQTRAYQANNNILLTDQAKMNSKPQLEIYADDVKCSHGATVGQLDPSSMFYLRSRGIPYREARLMLMYAFANDVISHIAVPPLRARINEMVDKRLRGELARCNACQISCGDSNC